MNSTKLQHYNSRREYMKNYHRDVSVSRYWFEIASYMDGERSVLLFLVPLFHFLHGLNLSIILANAVDAPAPTIQRQGCNSKQENKLETRH